MVNYVLAIKPSVAPYTWHDPSAAIFKNGELIFGVEEERYTREKHAPGEFPENAIQACLDHIDGSLDDVNKIILPQNPELITKRMSADIRESYYTNDTYGRIIKEALRDIQSHTSYRLFPDKQVKKHLKQIGSESEIPPIEHRSHHLCHAASAFYPTTNSEALVLTIDGQGEYDSTVVWHATETGLDRIRTYRKPNSLGFFFGRITEYLGYHQNNGEGKVMGLAPYGEPDDEIEEKFRKIADFGIDYDVTEITMSSVEYGVERLEEIFDHPRNQNEGEFDQFYKNIAFIAQSLIEETVIEIIEEYQERLEIGNVGLAGGVALNCKMNKQVIELESVDDVFIQPVANDAGLSLGAGWLETEPAHVDPMNNVYWGPNVCEDEIEDLLRTNKIEFERKNDLERYIAEQLANGEIIGWMQGRLEMGPRALGNRSILADPRTKESLDRVNEFVKHRETWRPFAPSILDRAADEYLVNSEESPYMIKTFDTKKENRDDIQAVIHPADQTTRPQTVSKEQNPRYYRLISEFADITGVPVILNTSFNDHGEPIVTTPREAVRDFYSMGLDILVIDDFVVEK